MPDSQVEVDDLQAPAPQPALDDPTRGPCPDPAGAGHHLRLAFQVGRVVPGQVDVGERLAGAQVDTNPSSTNAARNASAVCGLTEPHRPRSVMIVPP